MADNARDQLGVDLPEPKPLPEEPAAEEVAAEPERPDWLPENFKSPEDLARSYQESQRELTQTKQQVSALEQQFVEWQQALEQQQAQTRQPAANDYESQLIAAWERAYEEGDSRAMLGIAAALGQQAADAKFAEYQQQFAQQTAPQLEAQNELLARTADAEMAAQFSDWNDIKAQVGAVIEEAPHLLDTTNLATLTSSLKLAYDVAKARSTATSLEAVQAEQMRQQKLSAQTMSGAAGRADQPNPADEIFSRMRAASPRVTFGS